VAFRYNTGMNIDQRLEALTHAVEMLVQRQNSHDDNLDRLFEMQSEQYTRLTNLQAKNEVALAQLMESVNSLARIAHAHEQRITNLEDLQ
jgi:ABC-type transporter Mla subunit MlaD